MKQKPFHSSKVKKTSVTEAREKNRKLSKTQRVIACIRYHDVFIDIVANNWSTQIDRDWMNERECVYMLAKKNIENQRQQQSRGWLCAWIREDSIEKMRQNTLEKTNSKMILLHSSCLHFQIIIFLSYYTKTAHTNTVFHAQFKHFSHKTMGWTKKEVEKHRQIEKHHELPAVPFTRLCFFFAIHVWLWFFCCLAQHKFLEKVASMLRPQIIFGGNLIC